MLQSLHIENFRGFQEFDLENLGRITLLVGENNSGKTSILEAIKIVLCDGSFNVITEFMKYRGEYIWFTDLEENRQKKYLIRHLFHGYKILENFEIKIETTNKNKREGIYLEIQKNRKYYNAYNRYLLVLNTFGKKNHGCYLDLYSDDCITSESVKEQKFQLNYKPEYDTQLVTPFSLDVEISIQLFDNIVLSPNEQFIVEALQIIEPKIERIASVGQEKYSINSRNYGEKGGFIVKLSDQKQPISIGSLGVSFFRNHC